MTLSIQTGVNYEYVDQATGKFTLLQGGTRSGKTYSVLQWIVVQALTRAVTIDIFRKYGATHTNSLLRDWERILADLQIPHTVNKTERSYKIGQSTITFCGADDPQKLRGAGRDIAYLNEANELTQEDFMQIDFRTTQRVIMDFNPSMMRHWLYDLAKGPKADQVSFYKSTYRDNLFLSPQIIRSIEDLQFTNPAKWKVYGEGEAATAEEIIYPLFEVYDIEPDDQRIEWVVGLDFGFKAPSACVMVGRWANRLYIKELFYKEELTTAQIGQFLKDRVGGSMPIYADAAEPDRIAELQSMGLNVTRANKDVEAGIAFIHQFSLFIQKNSVNVLNEVQSYSWQKHADGSLLDKPLKKFDHSMDAMRYAAYTHWGHPIKVSAEKHEYQKDYAMAHKVLHEGYFGPSASHLY